MAGADAGSKDDSDLVTIRLRRVHVRLAAVLLLGFVLGYGTADLRGWSRSNSAAAQPASLASQSASVRAADAIRVEVSGRPAKGPERAAVTLVEFTDYQCPYCARHFRETQDILLAANAGHLRYVVRNFPVASLHPHAQKAAEAAECAFEQGKFWEYRRALFERSPRFPHDSLLRFAARLGLDMARFEACLDSGKKAPVVLQDLQDGQRYGVAGTPTFFINGKILVGAQPITAFQAEIDKAIQQR